MFVPRTVVVAPVSFIFHCKALSFADGALTTGVLTGALLLLRVISAQPHREITPMEQSKVKYEKHLALIRGRPQGRSANEWKILVIAEILT
jgi:hypothetical protein